MDNKKTAVRFLEAMGAGDGAAMDLCLARDATTEARNFCSVGGKNGREQMVAMASAFPLMMPGGLHFDILRIFGDERFVAVECDGKAVTARGDDYCNKYCFTFRFENGLIAQIHEYFCSKLADEVILPMVQDGMAPSNSQ